MTRKTILDKEEFEKRIQERLEESKKYNKEEYSFIDRPRKEWTNVDKIIYRNVRSAVYAEMRRELIKKRNEIWAMDITRGSINEVLNPLGFVMCRYGDVRCIETGAPIIKWLIEKFVFPQLRDKCGITGVKLKRNATPYARNLLDFSNADMDISLIKTEENVKE